MPTPISLDIPHRLGKAAARERLDRGIGKIGTMFPGGGQVSHSWDGDAMSFTVSAMGQTMRMRRDSVRRQGPRRRRSATDARVVRGEDQGGAGARRCRSY